MIDVRRGQRAINLRVLALVSASFKVEVRLVCIDRNLSLNACALAASFIEVRQVRRACVFITSAITSSWLEIGRWHNAVAVVLCAFALACVGVEMRLV